MRRRILSENVSDEQIFLFFALLGNSIPHLVRLSGQERIALSLLLKWSQRLKGVDFDTGPILLW